MAAIDELRVSNKGIVIPMAVVGAMLASVWFVAQQNAEVQALERRVYALEGRLDDQHKGWAAINERMARMEATMQSIAESLRQEHKGGPR